MITLSKTKFGKFIATGVGKITTDPSFKTVGKNDTNVCTFLLQSDTQKNGQTKTYDSYSVSVWGDDAVYASQLEKGDEIFIVGECKKDEYWSKRNGKDEFGITSEMIVPKNIGLIVLQMQMAFQSMNESSDVKPKLKHVDDDEFTDISSAEIPDFLKDIEPDI